ncbi:uroporphyrinogen-III synthase [Aquibaculum arenosum]|uniref:Uroporphyrinogen-III synthase n=1 Tax=Aquibaculum arenosum TaxID=3032591 RepID=A0ABT5YIF6_9PROT|nr:uroporphyrinogen-III synthase [Fodinicurvata sp. CAU 1616]MDF2094673.1 uroporphyrinogen-III synthase [Fodinicurvata sp. CAU 1616]
MRLLVTRPREDAGETLAALERRGHQGLSEPLLHLHRLAVEWPPRAELQALVITSRNGLRGYLAEVPDRSLPVYAVGPGSAEEARRAGFAEVHDADGDAHALADLIRRSLDPRDGALLHPSGRDVADGLSDPLRANGFDLRRCVVYAADAVEALSHDCVSALERGTLDGALFFSPRTGATFAALIEGAGLQQACSAMTAYCLSDAVAQTVVSMPWHAIRTAAAPNQAALLSLLPAQTEAEGRS